MDDARLSGTVAVASPNWAGGSGIWSTGFSPAASNGATLSFSGAGGNATNDMTLSIGSLTFSNGAGSYTVTGNALTVSNGIVNNSANGQTFSNVLTLGAAQSFNAASGNLTFAGNVTNGGNLLTLTGPSNSAVSGVISGTGGLSKTNTGIATLSGANTYSGGTTVNAGTLALSGSGTLGATNGALTIGAGTVNLGELTVTNGAFTLDSGTLTNGTLSATSYSLTNAGTISANLAGSAALTKSGSGTATLSGSNSYSGATTVSAGTLTASAANSLSAGSAFTVGTSGATSNRGALSIGNSLSNSVASLTLLGGNTSSANSGSVTIGTGSTLTVNGTISYETATNNYYSASISGGTLNLGGSTRTAAIFSNNNTADLTISSVIANGGLNKTQTGVLQLSGSNTFTGPLQISAGTLALSGSGSVSSATNISIASGATLDLTNTTAGISNGASQTFSVAATGGNTTATLNVASSKGMTLSAGGLAFTNYGAGTNIAPLTVAGPFAGALALNGAPVTLMTTAALTNGSYTLVAKSGSATGVSGTPGTLTVGGSGLVSGRTAALSVSSGALVMTVSTATLNPVTLSSPLTATYPSASAGVGFTASGSNLSGNITATAQTGYEVSTNNSSYAGSVSVASGTTVWVRTAANINAGSLNNAVAVVLSGGGSASSANVIASASGNSVAKANPSITWSSPAAITYGRALSSTQLNASSAVAGNISYNPTNGAVLAAGTNNLVATLTVTDSANYNSVSLTNTLVVNRAALTVTANDDSKTYGQTKTYGAGSTNFTSSGLTNSETISSVTITASGGTATNSPAGSYNLTPSLATGGGTFSTNNYTITYSNGVLTVNPAALTITANNVTKTQGATLSSPVTGSTSFTSSGLVNAESVSSVTISYGTGANTEDAAGVYTNQVTASAAVFGTGSASNYSISYVLGNITVSAGPTIAANVSTLPTALTTVYGTPSLTTSFTVSGSALTSDLTVTPPAGFEVSTSTNTATFTKLLTLTQSGGTVVETTVYVRLAGTAQVGGTYNNQPITISGGGASLTTVNSATTGNSVTPKPLTIGGSLAASNRMYNAGTNATVGGTASYVGLTNSDNFTVNDLVTWSFDSKVVGTNKLVSASPNFTNPSANYSVTQPTLRAEISRATLTFTSVVATSRVYAADNTNISVGGTPVGVLGSDSVSPTLTGSVTNANAGTNLPVTVAVTLGGADAGNYSAVPPTGVTVEITPADQTITFNLTTNTVTAGTTNALSATANSGLAVTFASANTAVATISGSNVIAVAPGVTTITASQAGNSNVAAATPVSQTLNVAAAGGTTTILTENMGSPASTTSIASNVFQNSPGNLTYSDGGQASPADVRATSASSGYTGASGSGNVFFTTTSGAYGFSIENINALGLSSLQLSYAYRKESASVHATFSVDYWNGSAWVTLANTSANLFNEAANAGSAWYLAKTLSLPADAQINGLKIRFVKTNTTSIRIDDVKLTGTTAGTPAITPSGTFPTLTTTYGTPSSSSNSVLVSGGSLTSNITATAPSNFQVSSDNTNWGGTAVYTNSGGFASGSLFLRLASNAAVQTYSNRVVALTSGSASYSIAIANSTVSPLVVTGSIVASNKVYDGTNTATVIGSLSGVLARDSNSVTLSGTATFDSANVGTNKTVTLNSPSLTGSAFGNYQLNTNPITALANITTVSLASNQITLTSGAANSYAASGPAGSTFDISYSGRTANGIATSYSSSTAPTAAGYYTVTATATGNYSGSNSTNTFVAGPVAVSDAVVRPTNNSTFLIPRATLLQNDQRIHTDGSVLSNNLSITGVAAGTGSPTVDTNQAAFISFTAGGAGVETFIYTLRDAVTGLSTTGTVTVTPQASQTPFNIAGTRGTPVFDGVNTTITMTFSGTANTTYYIFYKGELSDPDWKSAGGWYSENGTFNVEIQEAGDHVTDWSGSMFFRANQ